MTDIFSPLSGSDHERQTMTLRQINAMAKRVLENGMCGQYWVQAEISSISAAGSTGHCYMELIEKDKTGGNLVAKVKANIWRNTYSKIRYEFERQTGQRLSVGMSILALVTVSMHEVYGYSLVVQDIDPTFTLGDMERRRREILQRLKDEGVIDLNKELVIPMVPSRVAVISSETAAGYGDFCNQLANNNYGYRFQIQLFPALMQGDRAEASIIQALDRIAIEAENYDVVVIIRGGGATSDLSCFDSYDLALNVANFPLPVITGIGHERDDTVIDAVSNTRVKTPTAAAEFLISVMEQAEMAVVGLADRLAKSVGYMLEQQKNRLRQAAQKLPMIYSIRQLRETNRLTRLARDIRDGVGRQITNEKNHLSQVLEVMPVLIQRNISDQRHKLELMEMKLEATNPENVLKRGYTMTIANGRLVTDALSVQPGSQMETKFRNGSIVSVVKEIKQ